MIKRKKLLIPILVIVFTLLLSHGVSAEPAPAGGLLIGLDTCVNTGNCTLCDFLQVFVNAADILVGLSGAFAVVMFVYGGIVMITAYGAESRIKWGKDILIATTIGILIVLLAWFLVNIIIGSLYGTSSRTFVTWYNPQGICKAQ